MRLVLPATIKVIDVRENVENGQQVESFAVEALIDGAWTQVAEGATVGHRRLLPLDEPVTPSDVRVRILSSRAAGVSVGLSVHYDSTITRGGPDGR